MQQYDLHDLYQRLRLQFLVLLMMGAVTPETCRVILQWNKSDYILLHLVGFLLILNHKVFQCDSGKSRTQQRGSGRVLSVSWRWLDVFRPPNSVRTAKFPKLLLFNSSSNKKTYEFLFHRAPCWSSFHILTQEIKPVFPNTLVICGSFIH